MDLLKKLLPLVILANGFGDFILSTDPTGAVGEFMTTKGVFRSCSSPDKTLLAATFAQSFIFHAIVRVWGALSIKSRQARLLMVASYLCEVYQAVRLVQNGGSQFSDAAPLILAPLGAVAALLVYPNEDDKQKNH